MRILHLAYTHTLRFKGCSQNSIQSKLNNGLTRLGHHVISYSDRDIARMFGFGHMNFFGKKKVNQHLIEFCKAVQPDIIMMGHADNIELTTLLNIKKMFPHIKILEWGVDGICVSHQNPSHYQQWCQYSLSKLQRNIPVSDVILTTTAEKEFLKLLKTPTNKVGFFPNLVDKSVEYGQAFNIKEPTYDFLLAVSPRFERQFCGEWLSVESVAKNIMHNVSDLKTNFAGLFNQPMLNGADYQKACANSGMGLSLSHINDVYLYQSDRLAHLIGNGVLTFLDAKSGYKDFFNDHEIAFYSTPQELYEKIKFYKNNPMKRMEVAKAGHDKYVKMFHEKLIAQYFLDLLMGTFKQENYPWAVVIE